MKYRKTHLLLFFYLLFTHIVTVLAFCAAIILSIHYLCFYERNKGVELSCLKKYDAAYKKLLPYAKIGDLVARYSIGRMYALGLLSANDKREAANIWLLCPKISISCIPGENEYFIYKEYMKVLKGSGPYQEVLRGYLKLPYESKRKFIESHRKEVQYWLEQANNKGFIYISGEFDNE